jgi:hypothetical protein
VFFISLVLLDPLVVVLAALVLPAWPFTPAGLLLIIVFGAFVLATAPVMLHAIKIVRHSAPHSGGYPAR